MAEPQDAVLTILKNIQERITAFERRTDASLIEVKEGVLDQGERLEALHGLMVHHLGLTTEQQYQIAEIQKHFKELQSRVSTLEDVRS